LRRLFERYNRRFWGGKLPGYGVRVGKVSKAGPFQAYCDRRKKEITIDVPGMDRDTDRAVREQLLHEMCHAAVGGQHDDKFYAEIDRLRRLEAPVECPSERKRLTRWAFDRALEAVDAKFPHLTKSKRRK